MTQDDKGDFGNNFCRFGEKNIESDKVRDRFHLTGKKRGPAHSIFIINVKQSQSKFIGVILQ